MGPYLRVECDGGILSLFFNGADELAELRKEIDDYLRVTGYEEPATAPERGSDV